MIRYLAAIDGADGPPQHAAMANLRRRLEERLPSWRMSLDAPDCWVATPPSDNSAQSVVNLPNRSGVIVGSVFHNPDSCDVSPRPCKSLTETQNDTIIS